MKRDEGRQEEQRRKETNKQINKNKGQRSFTAKKEDAKIGRLKESRKQTCKEIRK
jgi:hypothetical protein